MALAVDLRTLDHQHEALFTLLLHVVGQDLQGLSRSLGQIVAAAITHQGDVGLCKQTYHITLRYRSHLRLLREYVVTLRLQLINIVLILLRKVLIEEARTTTENNIQIAGHKVGDNTLVIVAALAVSIERSGRSVIYIARYNNTRSVTHLLGLCND